MAPWGELAECWHVVPTDRRLWHFNIYMFFKSCQVWIKVWVFMHFLHDAFGRSIRKILSSMRTREPHSLHATCTWSRACSCMCETCKPCSGFLWQCTHTSPRCQTQAEEENIKSPGDMPDCKCFMEIMDMTFALAVSIIISAETIKFVK